MLGMLLRSEAGASAGGALICARIISDMRGHSPKRRVILEHGMPSETEQHKRMSESVEAVEAGRLSFGLRCGNLAVE